MPLPQKISYLIIIFKSTNERKRMEGDLTQRNTILVVFSSKNPRKKGLFSR